MFKIGDRVQLHPATDDWMRGDRYGDVVNVRRNLRTGALLAVTVKLDKSGKRRRFAGERVLELVQYA